EDESLMQPGDEFGDDLTKVMVLSLDGEDDGDGIGGPSADLDGVRDGQDGEFAIQAENFGNGAREFSPTQFKRGDVGESKLDGRADRRGRTSSFAEAELGESALEELSVTSRRQGGRFGGGDLDRDAVGRVRELDSKNSARNTASARDRANKRAFGVCASEEIV